MGVSNTCKSSAVWRDSQCVFTMFCEVFYEVYRILYEVYVVLHK
jgi:hypothetical protein